MYTRSYKTNNKIKVYGFEDGVLLPDEPPIEAFRNYGLPVDDQKFQPEPIPEVIWEDKRSLDKFAARQWHLRRHGEWWLIRGHKIYVPGSAWFFFNAWWCESGTVGKFKMEAVDFFQVCEHLYRSKSDYGPLIVKARRLGDTEKTLCFGYWMTTLIRGSWFGMQNTVDTEAYKNYMRVVEAHKRMVPWFKPQHLGSDRPETELVFDLRPKSAGERAVFEGEGSMIKGLASGVDYQPTVFKKYDGRRLRVAHLDEYGKIPTNVMNVPDQWGVLRECLSLDGSSQKVGFGILTTTVEQIKNGETIEIVQKLWDESNPQIRDDNGQTMTGLVRYIRDFRLSASVDEWGFHKVAELQAYRENRIAAMKQAGKLDDLSRFIRKYPDGVQDALAVPSTACILYPSLLDIQIKYAKLAEKGQLPAEVDFMPARPYDLIWTGSPYGSPVKAVPNPNGRFWISGMPSNPNARSNRTIEGGPGNHGDFAGIDGFDHKTGVSDGGFAIFRGLDMFQETEIHWEQQESGLVALNAGAMKTNRFVLTYRFRPALPKEFYDDCAKALWFYGCKALAETDKPGVVHFLEEVGMGDYLAYKPRSLKIGANSTNKGAKATVQFNTAWRGILTDHVHDYSETYSHLNQLTDFRNFTGDNQTKLDLLVASGFAVTLAKGHEIYNKKQERRSSRFTELPAILSSI